MPSAKRLHEQCPWSQETLLRICCAMLILIRRRLLAGDFTSNLKLLQNYPSTNISHLLYVANKLGGSSAGWVLVQVLFSYWHFLSSVNWYKLLDLFYKQVWARVHFWLCFLIILERDITCDLSLCLNCQKLVWTTSCKIISPYSPCLGLVQTMICAINLISCLHFNLTCVYETIDIEGCCFNLIPRNKLWRITKLGPR